MLMITLAVCWTRTPVADLPLLPILDSEILDPPSRSQLRDQPARLLATHQPKSLAADQDCDILGVPTGTADALTLEFATAPGALPIAFPTGFFAARPQKS